MSEKPRQKTAIVIGAGIGGTATAARLAHAGLAVTVLEKNDFTGGRCSLLTTASGYRFDQGPSLLLLPRLFHQTFAELGTSLEGEGVELRKCEPNYRIWFGDGASFEMSSDLARMKKEVEKWEGRDGWERYLGYLQEAHRHYELSVEHVLLKNFTSLASMLRPSFLRHLFELHPFESIWTRAGKYFWTERLRRVFTFGSMYMGMSPFDAPGTYSLLQYTELCEGIWYPVGGFHRVVEKLVEVGEREGVVYRLGRAVERIVLDGSGERAVGVRLEGGEMMEADVVVNNSDLVYAYTHLLAPEQSASLQGQPEPHPVPDANAAIAPTVLYPPFDAAPGPPPSLPAPQSRAQTLPVAPPASKIAEDRDAIIAAHEELDNDERAATEWLAKDVNGRIYRTQREDAKARLDKAKFEANPYDSPERKLAQRIESEKVRLFEAHPEWWPNIGIREKVNYDSKATA
ncbi:Phytoene desaturase [Friedmanniomyces simplex]|uniref:Phytoene desaturase n=1 Tax=Friedmanniomyces simplex TaxID=329884 RepID=A0A4U0WGP5_9PEZI|nr:Phytoene desaturase [Friedmanniomyces simplex]